MKFKRQTIIQIPSVIIGGVVGISLAYLDFGVWSLVYMGLVQVSVAAIQLWFYSSWRPKALFSSEKFKEHFNFGYKLALGGLLDTLYKNLYQLIIGKYYSAAQVGFYTRAWTTKQLPVTNISSALNKVTYPMFAEIKNDDARLKSVYKRVMQQVLFWIAPILTIAGVLAEPLFRFLFTEKWLPAVPLFQMFCVVGILFPLQSYNLGILKVKGRSDLFLRVEIIKKIFTISCVLLVLPFGIYALVGFQVFSSFVSLFINSYYSGRMINYKVWEQIKHVSPILGLSLVVGILSYLLDLLVKSYFPMDIIRLTLVGFFSAITYLTLSWLLALEPFLEFKIILLRKGHDSSN